MCIASRRLMVIYSVSDHFLALIHVETRSFRILISTPKSFFAFAVIRMLICGNGNDKLTVSVKRTF